MSFTRLENHSQLLCGRDFTNENSYSANLTFRAHKVNRIKQNYLK